jgi:hypothetical protein
MALVMPGSSQPPAMAMSHATATPLPPLAGGASPRQPHLRVLDARPAGPSATDGELPLSEGHRRQQDGDHVLVAGADASARSCMLAELRSLLPPGTRFVEASETWEVVARAAGSRMVVLAGDLGEASSASLLRLLARRNPQLPVLAVGGADRRSVNGHRAPAHTPTSAGDEPHEALDAAGA